MVDQSSIRTFFSRRSPAPSLHLMLWVLAASLLVGPGQSRADLGRVVAEGFVGSQFVRVRVEPFPARVGRAFLAVSIRNRTTGRPESEVKGSLTLRSPHSGGDHSGHGLHHAPLQIDLDPSQSRHPGLLGAVLDLPKTGTWSAEIRFPEASTPEVFTFPIEVSPRREPWIEYARAFSLPVLGSAIFFWHQRRVLRRKRPSGPS